MLQVATESLHPHLQARCDPTRRTSTLGFSLAVWASAAATMTMARMLLFNRRMFPDRAHHLGAGVLHLDFARDQADQRAAKHDQSADPDPRYQREDVGLNDGALVVVAHPAEVQVEVFVQALADSDFAGGLPAGLIEALFGLEVSEILAVLGDAHAGAMELVDGVFALG